jgi:hypothetical protein
LLANTQPPILGSNYHFKWRLEATAIANGGGDIVFKIIFSTFIFGKSRKKYFKIRRWIRLLTKQPDGPKMLSSARGPFGILCSD